MQALKKENKVILGAFVDPWLIRRIDEMRGQVPRSRIIEEVMMAFVKAVDEKKEKGRKNKEEGEGKTITMVMTFLKSRSNTSRNIMIREQTLYTKL